MAHTNTKKSCFWGATEQKLLFSRLCVLYGDINLLLFKYIVFRVCFVYSMLELLCHSNMFWSADGMALNITHNENTQMDGNSM